MKAYTYIDRGTFRLTEKADPEPLDCGDMIIAFIEEEGVAIELIERK